MNLLALQREIRDHLLHGRPDVGRLVRGEAAPRLAVYHNAYRMQLLACLRDTYEKTHAWLGDQNFDAAGLEHIASHTPVSWTLNDYGLNFDQTLAARYPDDPEVAELAWLEWALRRAFDGPDASPIAADGLTQIDWDHVVIRMSPTLQMAPITTNCAAIWTSISENQTPPAAALLSTKTTIRVWRQDLSPRFRSIGSDEQRAIAMTLDGRNFATICASLAEGKTEAETSAVVGGMLASWLQDGLITAIE